MILRVSEGYEMILEVQMTKKSMTYLCLPVMLFHLFQTF